MFFILRKKILKRHNFAPIKKMLYTSLICLQNIFNIYLFLIDQRVLALQ